MIERFNFYDLYGYLLPGAILLSLLMVPPALSVWGLPTIDWTSTIAFLVGAYLLGHLLQALAREAYPSTQKKRSGTPRYPSDILLDDANDTLPKAMKARLATLVEVEFGLNIKERSHRQLIFSACRQALQVSESPSYAEQFQGLYAFMRGLWAASLIAAAEYSGWVIGSFLGPSWWAPLRVAAVIAILSWTVFALRRWGFWLLVAVGAAYGALAGTVLQLAPTRTLTLLSITAGLFVTIRIARRAYEFFAVRFAATVYESYYVRSVAPRGTQPTSSPCSQ